MRVRGQHCVDLQDAMIGLSAHAFGDGSVRRSQVGAIDAVEGREDIELDEVQESAVDASLQKLVEVAVHRREGGAEVEEDGASVGLEEHLVPADDARAVPYREPRAHSPLLLSCPVAQSNQDVVRAVEDAWAKSDLDALDRYFAPEFRSHAAVPNL